MYCDWVHYCEDGQVVKVNHIELIDEMNGSLDIECQFDLLKIIS